MEKRHLASRLSKGNERKEEMEMESAQAEGDRRRATETLAMPENKGESHAGSPSASEL